MSVDPQALLQRIRPLLATVAKLEQCRDTTLWLAARHLPDMPDAARETRQKLLQLPAQLYEQEFTERMDELCGLWLQYRGAKK